MAAVRPSFGTAPAMGMEDRPAPRREGTPLMMSVIREPLCGREILIAAETDVSAGRWFGTVTEELSSTGLELYPARTPEQAISRVQRGGLAAAIVLREPSPNVDLPLLRRIRLVDVRLPCWLITDDTSRPVLETALELDVTSVITHSTAMAELTFSLRRVLKDIVWDR